MNLKYVFSLFVLYCKDLLSTKFRKVLFCFLFCQIIILITSPPQSNKNFNIKKTKSILNKYVPYQPILTENIKMPKPTSNEAVPYKPTLNKYIKRPKPIFNKAVLHQLTLTKNIKEPKPNSNETVPYKPILNKYIKRPKHIFNKAVLHQPTLTKNIEEPKPTSNEAVPYKPTLNKNIKRPKSILKKAIPYQPNLSKNMKKSKPILIETILHEPIVNNNISSSRSITDNLGKETFNHNKNFFSSLKITNSIIHLKDSTHFKDIDNNFVTPNYNIQLLKDNYKFSKLPIYLNEFSIVETFTGDINFPKHITFIDSIQNTLKFCSSSLMLDAQSRTSGFLFLSGHLEIDVLYSLPENEITPLVSKFHSYIIRVPFDSSIHVKFKSPIIGDTLYFNDLNISLKESKFTTDIKFNDEKILENYIYLYKTVRLSIIANYIIELYDFL
ncbi:hypothetical protein [Clostridium sp. LIBA-8841]|uniref:hypothetical protein n=1 Tax=Clostridium sp. LIBA-8841 TaxID=2987530 RepID=UPI002AC77E29|nr:hypothetical protein [Clostridium sp. LIBA-8841]MDZ5253474.1 hypothetical protein [Clostridium sp. LIBA-8841]